MRKKLLFLFIISALFVGYHSVQARMIVPSANITIVKESIGGDENFDFHYSSEFESKDFQIQTTNGAGSYLTSVTAFNDTSISLTENPIVGWQNTNIFCQSDDSRVTTYPINEGIAIRAYPYTSITCTFTNTKQNSKTPVLIVPGILGTDLIKGSEKL